MPKFHCTHKQATVTDAAALLQTQKGIVTVVYSIGLRGMRISKCLHGILAHKYAGLGYLIPVVRLVSESSGDV